MAGAGGAAGGVVHRLTAAFGAAMDFSSPAGAAPVNIVPWLAREGLCEPDGHHVHQITRLLPSAVQQAIPAWVNNFTPLAATWTARNLYVSLVVVTVYVAMCFATKAIMRDRLPYKLQGPLAAWNLLLAVFSFAGAAITMPTLLMAVANRGLEFTVCGNPAEWYGCGLSGVATTLFILSKLPELVDTVFVVLRKKPLIFLHWYHHVSVLLFCWHSFSTAASAGVWFVAMNYTVHAVMYLYYFLAAIGRRPSWAMAVTVLQLSQMGVGIVICFLTIWYKRVQGRVCYITDSNIYAGVAMYTSYALLFLHFFVNRFCTSRGKGSAATDKTATGNLKDLPVSK